METIRWTSKSRCTKTGDVPHAWIGEDKEACVKSCQDSGCPLLSKRYEGKNGQINTKTKLRPCYAHNGQVAFAFASIIRAAKKNPDRYNIKNAFAKALRSARMVRLSAIGNAGSLSTEQGDEIMKEAKAHDLGVLGYIAGFSIYPYWRDKLMASTYTLKMADVAIKRGWRPSTVLPEDHQGETFETPSGNIGIQCPAIYHKTVNCNQCGLCVRKWDPVKQLKRLKSMGIISKQTFKTIKHHKQAKNLIVGFITHQ
jgi:hypothetical protein